MKSRNLITSILGIAVFTALLLLGISKRADATSCGPGTNWVTGCAAGTDVIRADLFISGDLNLGGSTMFFSNVDLLGSATVIRMAATGSGANAQISTQISVSGAGIVLGMNVSVSGNGTGTIFQDPMDPFNARSFFDIVEVFSLQNGIQLFGTAHMRCDPQTIPPCRLPMVPPPNGTAYVGDTPLDLHLGSPTGLVVGHLTSVVHLVKVPEPSALLLLVSGLAGFSAMAWRRRRSS
jgi:hypothetical protein